MNFTLQKDHSIRSDSGATIRVTGMRSYEVETLGATLSIPIDYSGADDNYVNIWASGITTKGGEPASPVPSDLVVSAINILAEYLVSRSTKVCIRWSAENLEWRTPQNIPLGVRLADKIARLYSPKRRKMN
jgi:hypothetical protein